MPAPAAAARQRSAQAQRPDRIPQAGSSGAGHGRMRRDEIDHTYPGLAPPPARARLDFREGRCPFAGSPVLLEALARAASAAGVTALGAAAGREAAGGAGELRRRIAARGAGGAAARISASWGAFSGRIRCTGRGRCMRHPPPQLYHRPWPAVTPGITHGGGVGFQLRTVVALLLSRTPVTVNPRAVCICRCRGDSAIGGVRITPGRLRA